MMAAQPAPAGAGRAAAARGACTVPNKEGRRAPTTRAPASKQGGRGGGELAVLVAERSSQERTSTADSWQQGSSQAPASHPQSANQHGGGR